MKTLAKYILENIAAFSPETLINGLNYDFSSTSNMSSSSKSDRERKAKAQEQILIDAINNAGETYKAISIEEYCDMKNKTYSYELDSKLGDIVIMNGSDVVMFIDLKVADDNTYYGTPDMLSLVNFADVLNDKKYYLCCKLNGVDSKLIKANTLYDAVVSKTVSVIVSKDRHNASSKVKKLTNTVKIVAPYNDKSADTSVLYDEDFVSSDAIEKF